MSRASTPASRHIDESFHVAIAGPILTRPLARFTNRSPENLPDELEGTLVWQLVRDLLGREYRVSVVTLDQGVTTPVALSIPESGQPFDIKLGPYRARHWMRDLMRVERHAVRDGVLRTQPELVHAHWCYEYALGALASGVPTLVTVHDWAPAVLKMMETRYWPYWTGRLGLYFATLARARHLTAVSPYIACKVRRFSRGAVEVIPNGFPDGRFAATGNQPAVVSTDGKPIVVSVNNGFSPLKNVRRLLEAYRTLGLQGIECELHVIGDGYEPGGPCEAWAWQGRLAEGVTFEGPLPHAKVLSRMREATLLVHPAREESFGMTLIEAMSQRVPVIGGARSGAVPWVLDAGRAGLLVDVDNPGSIAEAIEALLRQPPLRERLALAGYRHAWQNFRQSRVTDLYLDAYRRLLAEEASK